MTYYALNMAPLSIFTWSWYDGWAGAAPPPPRTQQGMGYSGLLPRYENLRFTAALRNRVGGGGGAGYG
jgi:hypothetical protein